MEHNFDPTKGDYKYILEEERRKQNGELLPETEKSKVKSSWLDRFRNFFLILFFRRTRNH